MSLGGWLPDAVQSYIRSGENLHTIQLYSSARRFANEFTQGLEDVPDETGTPKIGKQQTLGTLNPLNTNEARRKV